MAVVSNQIVPEITNRIKAAFTAVSAKTLDVSDARDMLNSASEAATSVRVQTLIELSELSAEHKWELDWIDMAIAAAKAARNDQKDTTIHTFASELRKAMRAGVRGNVRQMFQTAKAAWDEEGKLDKGKNKPLRSAFVRQYHMVVGPMFDMAAGGLVPSAQDMVEAATKKLRERELDHTRAWKGLKACYDTVKSYSDDFPVDGLDMVLEYLQTVLYRTDKDGKQVPNHAEFKKLAARKLAPVAAPAPMAAPVPDKPVVESEPQSTEDAMAEALAGIYGQAA